MSDRQLRLLGERDVQVKRSLPLSIVLAGALVAACALAPSTASAQTAGSDKARAKEAYDRGVEAHKRGDFSKAAREFAEADAIAPSNVALQAALDAAVDADDPALGSELLERSKRGPVSGTLAQSVAAAKQKLAGRAGRVRVECPSGSKCSATIDGATIDTKRPAWARTGPHTVIVNVDGDPQSKVVDVKADQTVDVVGTAKSKEAPLPVPTAVPMTTPSAPPEAPPKAAAAPPATATATPPSREAPASAGARSGAKLPPLVFFVGLGATVVAGAAATYFMLDTKSKHDDFVSNGCEAAPQSGCTALKDDGESAQTIANIGIGATALFAVATIVIGAAFTDWRGKTSHTGMSGPHVFGATRPVLAPPPGGGLAGGAVVRF
jgi:hypothetical protein